MLTELLCKHLGHRLENDDLIEFIEILEIPTGLTTSGPPLPIPRPHDFPDVGFLTADQVQQEYFSLKDQDLSHEDEDIQEAREGFPLLLEAGVRERAGLVSLAI